MKTADQILKDHEDANEMHFHQVDREWIIEAMEEYANTARPWIKCSEQMPKKRKMVQLCHCLDGYVTAGFFDESPSGHPRWVADGEHWFWIEFSHWMPLAEPPKQ